MPHDPSIFSRHECWKQFPGESALRTGAGIPKYHRGTICGEIVPERNGFVAAASSACVSPRPALVHCGSLPLHFARNNKHTNSNINLPAVQSRVPLIGAAQTVDRRIF